MAGFPRRMAPCFWTVVGTLIVVCCCHNSGWVMSGVPEKCFLFSWNSAAIAAHPGSAQYFLPANTCFISLTLIQKSSFRNRWSMFSSCSSSSLSFQCYWHSCQNHCKISNLAADLQSWSCPAERCQIQLHKLLQICKEQRCDTEHCFIFAGQWPIENHIESKRDGSSNDRWEIIGFFFKLDPNPRISIDASVFQYNSYVFPNLSIRNVSQWKGPSNRLNSTDYSCTMLSS